MLANANPFFKITEHKVLFSSQCIAVNCGNLFQKEKENTMGGKKFLQQVCSKPSGCYCKIPGFHLSVVISPR